MAEVRGEPELDMQCRYIDLRHALSMILAVGGALYTTSFHSFGRFIYTFICTYVYGPERVAVWISQKSYTGLHRQFLALLIQRHPAHPASVLIFVEETIILMYAIRQRAGCERESNRKRRSKAQNRFEAQNASQTRTHLLILIHLIGQKTATEPPPLRR